MVLVGIFNIKPIFVIIIMLLTLLLTDAGICQPSPGNLNIQHSTVRGVNMLCHAAPSPQDGCGRNLASLSQVMLEQLEEAPR